MIDRVLLESAAAPPASIAGLVTPMVLVPLDRWTPGQTAAQWTVQAQQARAQAAKGPWAMNVGGWGVRRLMDETIPDSYKLPNTNTAQIVMGIKRGVFAYEQLLPIWQPAMDAQTSLGVPRPSILWDDGFEKVESPSPAVRAAFSSMTDQQFQQAFGQAAYNTIIPIARYFGIQPQAVVCAGIANAKTPWTVGPVACVTSHVWMTELPIQPNSVVTISVGAFNQLSGAAALPCIAQAIRECAQSPHRCSVILYHEAGKPDSDTNLNSSDLLAALKTYAGGN